MQAEELLAWHQPALAVGDSQDQYEALLIFIPSLGQSDFLLAV